METKITIGDNCIIFNGIAFEFGSPFKKAEELLKPYTACKNTILANTAFINLGDFEVCGFHGRNGTLQFTKEGLYDFSGEQNWAKYDLSDTDNPYSAAQKIRKLTENSFKVVLGEPSGSSEKFGSMYFEIGNTFIAGETGVQGDGYYVVIGDMEMAKHGYDYKHQEDS